MGLSSNCPHVLTWASHRTSSQCSQAETLATDGNLKLMYTGFLLHSREAQCTPVGPLCVRSEAADAAVLVVLQWALPARRALRASQV